MKSVFVLGLALAANAQMDNEFASFTGADLVRHHADIRPNPHHVAPAYVVRKDDIVDDEFFGLSGADLVKYAKQSQQTVYRPTAHVVRDDEFFGSGRIVRAYDPLNPLRTNPPSESESRASATNATKKSDITDDGHTHHTDLPYTGNNINWKKIGKFDTVTNHFDDEELFGTGHVVRQKYNTDTLNPLRKNPEAEGTTTKKSSNVVEDVHTHHTDLPYTGNNINWKKIGKSDTVTNHLDDELFGSGRVVQSYDPLNPLRTNPPSESESAASATNATKKSDVTYDGHTHHTDLPYTGNNINWKKIGKSDTVTNHLDDELVYLEHLIKETRTQKPEIRRKFRPVEIN